MRCPKMSLHVALVGLSLSTPLVACINLGEPEEAAPNAPGPAPSSSSGGGSPGVSSGGDADGELGGAKHFGTISFETQRKQGDEVIQSVVAGFLDAPSPGGASTCASPEKIDGCIATVCDPPKSGAAPPVLKTWPAGKVSVVVGGTETSLEANDQGLFSNTSKISWQPGMPLTGKVTGAADGAPPFELTTNAPSSITVTAPSMTSKPPLPIAAKHRKSEDLVVRWTGGSAGNVRVALVGANEAGKIVKLECDAAAPASAVKVSAGTLARFATPRLHLTVDATSNEMERKGDWVVGVIARAPAVTADGRAVSGFLGLE